MVKYKKQEALDLANGPEASSMATLPAAWAAKKSCNIGVMQKSKILQSYQAYSMLLFHKPTNTYHELVDDTLNTLQLLDSTIPCIIAHLGSRFLVFAK